MSAPIVLYNIKPRESSSLKVWWIIFAYVIANRTEMDRQKYKHKHVLLKTHLRIALVSNAVFRKILSRNMSSKTRIRIYKFYFFRKSHGKDNSRRESFQMLAVPYNSLGAESESKYLERI